MKRKKGYLIRNALLMAASLAFLAEEKETEAVRN